MILSVLAWNAGYGYQIIKQINDEADGLFNCQEGTVYPLLYKLEKDSPLRTQWQQADTGRRRKYYYITAEGRDALERGAREWTLFHGKVTRLAPEMNL